jgi:two-component system NtrC family response regulator
LLELDADVKVIVLTGQNDRANALRAVAMGAYDFFAKPFEPELLALTIERAYRLAELQAENRRLQAMQQPDALGGLITRDPEMLRVCRTDRESGQQQRHRHAAGRERHRQGGAGAGAAPGVAKRSGKFVAINCAAIPETCWKANSSATRRARSPAPPRPRPARSRRPTAAR